MISRSKISVILSILLLTAAWPVYAQVLDNTLLRRGSNLVNRSGNILTDAEVLDLVGEPIYYETYVNAKKQYKTGRTMIWSGSAGLVIGLGAMGVGGYSFAGGIVRAFSPQLKEESPDSKKPRENGIHTAAIGMMAYDGGALLASAGFIVLCGGISFSIKGKKNLNRVVDEYNAGSALTYNVGATPNGVGIVLRF